MTNEFSKSKILVVDDSRLNRLMLSELLSDEYIIEEAENGEKAVAVIEKNPYDIDLVILDLVMPVMDGFKTLEIMRERNWLSDIPVIVVSAEDDKFSMEKVYNMGAVDFFPRPYDSAVIHKRITNTLALYAKQRRLLSIVKEQVSATENYSRQMIDILGNIVEFRNGESNLHIHNVQTITRILLERLNQLTDKYELTSKKIMLISTASALHDIGKIAIDESILNKPGRLTPREFDMVRRHSEIGSQMIKAMPGFKQQDDDSAQIYKYAYDICRWHHERWTGLGYPDRLAGDEIPISAQVVAMADVYDALTSKRSYKDAYSHEIAVEMILSGECGAFNPLLYDCFKDTADYINNVIHTRHKPYNDSMAYEVTQELIADKVNSVDDDKRHLLSYESAKRGFFSRGVKEIQFDYDVDYGMVTVSDYGVKFLDLDSSVVDVKTIRDISSANGNFAKIMGLINKTTPGNPFVEDSFYLDKQGKKFLCEVKLMALWDGNDTLRRKGIVIRVIPNNIFETLDVVDSKDYNDKDFEDFEIQMSKVFDTVRVVDPIKTEVASGEHLTDCESELAPRCYSFWNRSERCRNCVSYKALKTKKTQSKLEFFNDSVYQVFAKYMEINGEPRIVEMVYQSREDMLIDANGKNELVNYVKSYNRRLYRDSLTDVYNRRYFEEFAKSVKDVVGVVMIDIDNFKSINDEYGHIVGDMSICAVARAIMRNIGDKDRLIRYGGDEFVLLLVDVKSEEFDAEVKKIVRAVKRATVPGEPQVKLSVTAGGIKDFDSIDEAVKNADRLMYNGKLRDKHVIIGK